MSFRRFYIIFILLAGFFAFHGHIESPRLPQVPQTELVVVSKDGKQAIKSIASPVFKVTPEYFVSRAVVSLPDPHHHKHHSSLIDYQHHHSTL